MKKKFVAAKSLLIVCLFSVIFLGVPIDNFGQDVLYGMTQHGGSYNKGVPYQVNTDGTGFFSFRDFDGNEGEHPGDGARFSQLTETGRIKGLGLTLTGNLAGLTELGYRNLGYGNRVQIVAGTSGLVAPFGFTITTSRTGSNPAGGFLPMSNGTLYGLMSKNGQYGGGTLFSVGDAFVNGITVLASFDGVNTGRFPKGTLIQGSDGRLYGTTEFGGLNDHGVIFSFDGVSLQRKLIKLMDFDGLAKGANPTGNLLLASNGRLYGMTKNGGAYGHGVVFSIFQDGTGYTKLLDLNGQATGSNPKGSLTAFTDGNLYGMTSSGGAHGFGTIFRISLTGNFVKIIDFDGNNGKAPVGDLLVDVSGTVMYGVTYAGGSNDQGVLFKLQNGNQFTKLYDYKVSTGNNPVGALAMIRKQPNISVQPVPVKTTLSAPFKPTVIAEVDLPVYFASSDPSVIAVENNMLVCKGAGTAEISVIQLGDHAYLPVTEKTRVTVLKTGQTITFNALPVKTFGDTPFNVIAVTSSGLPATFSSSNQSVATVNGNVVTIKGAGHVSILAHQSGDEKYESAAPVEQHLFVERAEQSITFNPTPVRTCCDFFSLTATSSAGLPVLFKSGDLMGIEISGTSAQPRAVGKIEILAFHQGNKDYKPAEKRASVDIQKANQNITFSAGNTPYKVGDAPLKVTYGTNSGLPITFTSTPPGIAVVENGYLYFLAEGTTTISAVQPGDERYYSATPLSIPITVGPASTPGVGNTILFSDLVEKTVVDPAFNLTAIASSGLPVSYTSTNPAVAEVSGNLVTIRGVGKTTITASQPGTSDFPAATPVLKELVVKKKNQNLSVSNVPSSLTFGVPPIPLNPTTSEGLPVTYTLSDNTIGSIERYYLTILGAGTLTITASQSGNDQYLPAQSANATVSIYPINDNLYFKSLPELTYGDNPLSMEAWAASGLPVKFSSSEPDVASVNGSILTIKAAGPVKLVATSINPGYNLSQVQQNVVIRRKKQHITFLPLESKKFGDAPFEVSANSTSEMPVILTSLTPGVVRTDGQKVTIVGNGVAELVASQPGNTNWEPAESVHQTFLVSDVGKTYELVGSTSNGGPNYSGVVFSMNSDGTAFEYLKQFAARTSPSPQAGFIKGIDGKLYGNLMAGGTSNAGSVIRMEADGTGLTYLHHFRTSEGKNPMGNLIQATDGYLYGTTQSGGDMDGGTIFRLKPDGTAFKVIYNLSALTGKAPRGGVTQADNGKLYGIAPVGGFYGSGTIFSINTDGSGFSVLFHLNDQAPVRSGVSLVGELVQGPDGFLYGAARFGGDFTYGTLFKINTDGSGFTKIVNFNGTTTGMVPASDVLFSTNGKVYGMTAGGGLHAQGTIYAVNPDGTNYVQIFSFEDTNSESSPLGSHPFGKLTEGNDGFLYGCTAQGGSNGKGTIFKVDKNGTGFQILVNLDARASYPAYGPLVESTPGDFFGMTSMGGNANKGAIFKVNSSGDFRIISDFPQEQTSPRNLISDTAGDYYYGITQANSLETGGSIFRVSASGASYMLLYKVPPGEILTTIFYSSTGHLWVSGVHNDENFMFRMKPDGTGREDIVAYNSALAEKRCPVVTLVETQEGEIFGGTDGSSSPAFFFKIKNDGTGYSKLFELPFPNRITADLLHGTDGNFYTAYNHAGVFKFTPAGVVSNIFVHPYPNDSPEVTKIIEMNGGRLGITTRLNGSGGLTGASNYGTIFSIEKDGTGYHEIFAFVSRENTTPVDMVQSIDGWLYIVSEYGGVFKKGLVYKLRPDGTSYTKIREFNGENGENPNGIFFRRVAQSFTFAPLPEKKTSDPAFLPTIVTTSGAPIQLSSSNPAVAIIENGRIKPVGAGTTMIAARLLANVNYFDGGRIERPLIITKGSQAITFLSLSPTRLQKATIELTAVSTSGLSISYQSSNPLVASVSGSTVSLHTVGSTTITASQAGNDNFSPAASVSQVLVVTDGAQSISFNDPGTKVMGDAPFQLDATATSGLPVVFSSNSDKIVISGSYVTILRAGIATIWANQPGNNIFEPATPLEVSFCINPPRPVITESGQAPDIELHSSIEIGNQWYLNNEALIGYASQSIVTPEEGSFSVEASVDGCVSERSLPTIFVTTSIEELKNQSNVFPNPALDILYVEIAGNIAGFVRIELLDIAGRLLESRDVTTAGTSVFHLKRDKIGIVLVKVIHNEKIIVRKIFMD